MQCPVCGNEMAKGKVMISGRMSYSYWAEDEYFEKHPWNPSYRFESSIEKEGGVILDIYRNDNAFYEPPEGVVWLTLPVLRGACHERQGTFAGRR